MRVRFLADFDWSPPELGGRSTTAYRKGSEETVTRACGEAAVNAGKAAEIEAPRREQAQPSALSAPNGKPERTGPARRR